MSVRIRKNSLTGASSVTQGTSPWVVSGTVTTGGLTDAELRATAVPISAASLPLPSGASTSALQSTGNTSLGTIAGAVAGSEMQVDIVSMPSATVTATDLDIRNLVFATDKVDVSGSTLGANSGVDIGDTTINNAAGASAVNIQDGGNIITVDGTVAATQSGTWTEANSAAIAASASVLDDWDETNRAAVNLIASQVGVAANAGLTTATTVRVVQAYGDGWLCLRANYTSAQTDTAVVTAGSSERIAVKRLSVYADNANTVDVAARIGFGASATPTTTSVILSHPGIASGSGAYEYYGSDGVYSQTNGDDLRITSEVPTTGSIDVVVIYKLI